MTDWTGADWIDPRRPWTNPLPVPEYPERLLVDFATRCNLRCPMCPVWGSDDERAIDEVTGVMDVEGARRLLDEVMAAAPMVAPSVYGEPLLIPDLREILTAIKQRGMPIAMNTNGLTLTDALARCFVDLRVDSVMFSLDAVTKETLQKVRGIDRLEKIESNVFRLMRVRGEHEYPRVGVSFTIQGENAHELDAFVARWVGVVDVVRTCPVFDTQAGTFTQVEAPADRRPCPAIYKTMAVHNDGTVRLCCLDGFRATDMGNVFGDGVKAVWRGEAFAKARYYHETGQWDRVPFCKPCNGWVQYDYDEEIRDGILIRRSPQFTYYNTIDRLQNWKGRLLGGHTPPPADLSARASRPDARSAPRTPPAGDP
jgi:pyruvate-formate lyase-activating enzyme